MGDRHICSWRHGRLLSTPARRLLHHPEKLLKPYLQAGMTAADIGCGMGFFTIPMAGMVGGNGRVLAIDLQPEMLDGLTRRAAKYGRNNITPHLCGAISLRAGQWNGSVNFALLFFMMHEVPNAQRLAREVFELLAPGGVLFFAEPAGHVQKEDFLQSVRCLTQCGFALLDTPRVAFGRAVAFQKTAS